MPTEERTLAIRADADPRMGTGHVMRCLALAQAWQEAGGRVILISAAITPALERRVHGEGIQTMRLDVQPGSLDDAVAAAASAHDAHSRWMVVDGYQFGADYQQAIKTAGLKLLFIDDYGHAGQYAADLVLNQNLHAEESLYRRREPYTRLLLGPQYAMLRKDFLRWLEWRRQIPEIGHRLLVAMGGSDPDNVTLSVIEALAELDLAGLEITAIVGGSNPHQSEIADAAIRTRVQLQVDVADMARWMAWADLAITAAGSTVWELAFLGLPSLTVILADNQESVARALDAQGIFPTLGWGKDTRAAAVREQTQLLLRSREMRQTYSEKAARLVDGRGVFRVLEHFDS